MLTLRKQTRELVRRNSQLIRQFKCSQFRVIPHQRSLQPPVFSLKSHNWLGSDNIGFFGMLQTWGQDPMIFHPHVHFIVPCGGVSEDGRKWLATPSTFLFPEAVASPIYRQKFREILRAAGLEKNIDPSVWHKWWEVNVKPVSDGRAVLKYLAPYVF